MQRMPEADDMMVRFAPAIDMRDRFILAQREIEDLRLLEQHPSTGTEAGGEVEQLAEIAVI